MNLLDAYVTEVLGTPRFEDYYKDEGIVWWAVPVKYNSYGVVSETELTFKTREEAEKVKVGYHFLS
ncbi:hypothetical protein [Paenibacillus sp. GYB003]|uniref:hypothetical protein n=1 Tax=Paenibacillus sp. GYB003 TaxID=2994392 RepID=UPI002F96734B